MAKLNTKTIQDEIRTALFNLLLEMPEVKEHGEQIADFSIALPVTNSDGVERWGVFEIKSKYAGEKKPSFDPFEAAEDWKLEKEAKAREKELKAKVKAEKLARAKAKGKSSKPTEEKPSEE